MRDDEFEWDDAKAARNWAEHGVGFDAARLAFEGGAEAHERRIYHEENGEA